MKAPRRRTLVTSVRVALASGAATVGWLVAGAAGAHAVEDLPTVPEAGAPSAIARTVAGSTPGEVLEAAQRTVSAAAPSDVAAAEPLDPRMTTEPGAALVERSLEALRLQPLTGLVVEPVETVQPVVEPVARVVEDVSPVTVPAPMIPPVPTAVEGALPPVPVAEEILPVEPARAVGSAATPDPVPAAPPAEDGVESLATVASAQGPEAELQTARTEASAVTTPDVAVTARTARPSPGDFLAGLEPFRAAAQTSSTTLAGTPFSTLAEPSRAGGAVLPGTGATTSAAGSGGSGTPLRGAGPDSWPEVPAGHPCLELFPQRKAAQTKVFFAGIEQPPAPPAFDPGSTPD